MKRKIILMLALIGLLSIAYVYAQGDEKPLANEAENFSEEKIKEVQENAGQQAKEISGKVKNFSEETKKVLGAVVKISEEDPQTLQQKAIEHGQYLYCKQVVESYEQ